MRTTRSARRLLPIASLTALLSLLVACSPGASVVVKQVAAQAASAAPGPTWVSRAFPDPEADLNGVDFIGVHRGWVVGINGMIAATADGGASWKVQARGQWKRFDLKDVAFANSKVGWAVGHSGSGAILATRDGGATWRKQLGNWDISDFQGVASVDARHAWAVGFNGTVWATTDGVHWRRRKAGSALSFQAVTFANRSDGWAVGFRGNGHPVIASTHDGGRSWHTFAPRSGGMLVGIACADARHAWAVGGGGLILTTRNGGANWKRQRSGTTADLSGVAFSDAQHGWAVGNISANGPVISNVLLSTSDGGATWATQTPDTVADLNDMTFVDRSHGWVAGGHVVLAYGEGSGQ